MPAVLSYATLEPTTDDNKFDLLAKILLALLAGGSGGTVALENVTGISDFWKATLSGTPAANQVFGTDGAGVFTTFNISEVGINTLSLPTPDSLSVFAAHPDGAVLTVEGIGIAEIMTGGTAGATASQTPVNAIDVMNGVVVSVS